MSKRRSSNRSGRGELRDRIDSNSRNILGGRSAQRFHSLIHTVEYVIPRQHLVKAETLECVLRAQGLEPCDRNRDVELTALREQIEQKLRGCEVDFGHAGGFQHQKMRLRRIQHVEEVGAEGRGVEERKRRLQ